MISKWLIYLFIFIAGFIGLSWWSFWLVIHPAKLTTNLSPTDFSLPYEQIAITAPDNTILSGWLMPSPSAEQKIIIILHGYPADKSDMLRIAAALYPDFSVLLLDLRYFGQSQGSYTSLGVKELGDIHSVVNLLEHRGYEQVGVFGFSLGGAIGLMAAAEDGRIKAVASYASYADIRRLGRETYRDMLAFKYPLVELMIGWSKLFFGSSVAKTSPEQAASRLTMPVFLIHTQQDEQIDFFHAQRLKNALQHNSGAEFYFPPTGLHGELPLDFYEQLKSFFSRSL